MAKCTTCGGSGGKGSVCGTCGGSGKAPKPSKSNRGTNEDRGYGRTSQQSGRTWNPFRRRSNVDDDWTRNYYDN